MLQSSRTFHATFNFILTGSASSPAQPFPGGKATRSVPGALWELYEDRVTYKAPSTHECVPSPAAL